MQIDMCVCPPWGIVICAKWRLYHHGWSTLSSQYMGGLRLPQAQV